MATARDARTPGYAQWVHLMKNFSALFQEQKPVGSHWRTGGGQWLCTQIEVAPKNSSWSFKLHTND